MPAAAKPSILLSTVLCFSGGGCTERTEAPEEQCFYIDPGYWIDPGGVTRTCDDIDRSLPEGPDGAMVIGAIVRVPPAEDGICELCPEAELDEELIEAARTQIQTQNLCSIEAVDIAEVHRLCVSPPEQTSHVGSDDCWYRASVFFFCDQEG